MSSNASDSAIIAAASFLSDARKNVKLRTIKETVAGADIHTLKTAAGAYQASVAIVRPANTTAFTALDVVGQAATGILEFTNIGPKGGFVEIKSVELRVDLAAVTASMAGFTLHLYDASPTDILDNAAFNLPSGDRGKYLGSLDIGTPVDQGATLFIVALPNKIVKLASGSTSLFAFLSTVGGYTPTSAESLNVRMTTKDVS